MFHVPGVSNSRIVLRLAAAGLAASLLAGCSSDVTRLSDPFGNPFSGGPDRTATGTIAPARAVKAVRSASVLPVTSSPLAAAPALSPRLAYNAPVPRAPAITSSIPAPQVSRAAAGGWSADGGTPIVAAQGETAGVLATRYGVPVDALLRTNGFSSAAQVAPGTRLVVPVYGQHALAQAAPVKERTLALYKEPAETTAAPHVARAKMAKTPVVAAPRPPRTIPEAAAIEAQTATMPARQLHVKTAAPASHAARAQMAKAAPAAGKPVNLAPPKVAAVKKPPARAKLAAVKAPVAAKPAKVALAKPALAVVVPHKAVAAAPQLPKPAKVAAVKPGKAAPAPAVDTQPTAALPPAAPAPVATADAANPEFRWPARGRIIQGFKSGGNDGINIAVPEGTSVKAAEGGVVAYAGNELKGYGNLVLIRHPNGFVSAYANNGELDVKRGETVKRGQTIAKSGQSGNVASPQLHFELRKGSTPVDPTGYLAGL